MFHYYSFVLHTCIINYDDKQKKHLIQLCYEFDSDIAKMTFLKDDQEVYLLDEIYMRTIKMEQERRYCMRFIRPYCNLDQIDVRINIDHAKDIYVCDKITYSLLSTLNSVSFSERLIFLL